MNLSLDFLHPDLLVENPGKVKNLLFLGKDERRGDLTEHILEVNLSTSRFRWGILYSRYYFSYIDETQKYLQKAGADDFFDQENVLQRTSQTYTNSLILGVRGRVPGRAMGRAYWNIETEYFQSDTSGERPRRFTEDDFFDETTFHNTKNMKAISGNLNSRAAFSIRSRRVSCLTSERAI